ncbi:aminoacyl-tRNA hydrolase [SCandidatus Aminicenantes bacterium Aminicenantia_JdfR_composite]|nr:aminoacyl-tRNA hydrolase [SCandidatus Aminicenantes bacterium Aminicenantia_JdfR_composite]MCP2597700.1 aminoacyl-tRNA hydrolase [Candidatus Aminicenantes bacterium AC-335-G13]
MWILIGLGNPGREFARTRHNAGFKLINILAKEWGVRVRKRRFLSKIGEVDRRGEKILLVKPQTYMNLSGKAVKLIVDNLSINLENMIVIYDDIDIPLGEIRIRKKGSAGTHKGVQSIITELGTENFPRLRIGIGKNHKIEDLTQYVLSPFEEDELPLFKSGLNKAKEAINIIMDQGIDKAMSVYNKRGEKISLPLQKNEEALNP